jgi:hypothetical protein
MKKLSIKANTNVAKNTKVMSAVNHFVKQLNADCTDMGASHFRYFTRDAVTSDKHGELVILDITGEYDIWFTIYEAAGDLFIVPQVAFEGGWSGVSVNGQSYTVEMVVKGMDEVATVVLN